MKENTIGGAAAGLYLRHPTNARGLLDRSAPAALASDPTSGPVPRRLTGRGRLAQLRAHRLPEGSPGARAAPSGASAGPSAWPVGLQRGAHGIRAHHMMETDTGRTAAPSLDEMWEMPFRPRHVLDPPPDDDRGHPDRPAPAALAGDPACGPLPGMLTGRGRLAQLGARRLPEGSPGAWAASTWSLRKPLRVARRAAAVRAHHLCASHDGA